MKSRPARQPSTASSKLSLFNRILGSQIPSGLQRMFGIKEGGVGQISPEIQASYDYSLDAEFLAMRGGDLAYGSNALAALAANNNHILLANPVNSGLLIHVRAIICESDVAALVAFGQSQGATTGVLQGNGQKADGRRQQAGVVGVVAGQLRTLQQVGALFGSPNALRFRVAAATALYIPVDVVLMPNDFCGVANLTVNQVLDASFIWTERPARSEELQRGL